MKAKKKSGSTKGKAGKRAVKDLPAKSAASVKGGALAGATGVYVKEPTITSRTAGKGQLDYL